MTVAIENDRLIEKFPIFKETDPGCCASLAPGNSFTDGGRTGSS
jgi:hypothetical protein